jgi:hydroxymethylglutaryl-CoA synthase
MTGICSFGGYVPRYRLPRKTIFDAMGWMNPGNIAHARGHKAVASFDEDTLTLAVAAGADALGSFERSCLDGVFLASTTLPYRERLNAAIAALALGADEQIRAADFTGGLRAGTSALLSALEAVQAGGASSILVCAADCRQGKPASPQELIFGDAGAALRVGREDVLAEFRGSYSITCDFGDHTRGSTTAFDRQWEERWIRDAGYDRFLPDVIRGLLQKYGLAVSAFTRILYPCHSVTIRRKINQELGILHAVEPGNLQEEIGDTGTAHPLVLLVRALEEARPGDRILVVSFGSGCDALDFEVTEQITRPEPRQGIAGCLARGRELDAYTKYLVWRDILPADMGLRAEEDLWTRWSLLWRKRREVLGLWGTRCRRCGTPQYPAQRVCVHPDCSAVDEMEPYRFSDRTGRIASYTGDMLAASSHPPAVYGQVVFDGGGKYMFDFTDCALEDLAVDGPVRMSFRRKYSDRKRDLSGYFWKAVPL